MKRLLSVMMILSLMITGTLLLTGCDKQEETADPETTEEPAVEEEEEYVPEVTEENSAPENVVVKPSDETASSSGISFETNDGAEVIDDGSSVSVYINGSMGIPYYYVYKMDLAGQSIEDIYAAETENVNEQYNVRIVNVPASSTTSGNGRTLTGIVYSFSSEDGSNVIKAIDYIDKYDENTAYRWVGFYYDDADLGKMKTAMTTFTVE